MRNDLIDRLNNGDDSNLMFRVPKYIDAHFAGKA